MKRIFLLFIPLFFAQDVQAQRKVLAAIEKANRHIMDVQQGYFDCTHYWKSAAKADTVLTNVRVWFFRHLDQGDTVSQIVVFERPYGNLLFAYDGETWYNNYNFRITASKAVAQGGALKLLQGALKNKAVYEPFLFNGSKAPFEPARFEHAIVQKVKENGNRILRISVPNWTTGMQVASPPEHVRWIKQLDFALPQLHLIAESSTVHFSTASQYSKHVLSPITALPNSVTFLDVFNRDSLERQGYLFQDVPTLKLERPVLVAVGDTVSRFTLPDLDGVSVSPFTQQEGYILFDFWHQKCGPCLMAAPQVDQFLNKYKGKGLRVYGINARDKDPTQLRNFISQKMNVHYPTLLDSDHRITQRFNIMGFPTFVLVEAHSRKVVAVEQGFSPARLENLGKHIR